MYEAHLEDSPKIYGGFLSHGGTQNHPVPPFDGTVNRDNCNESMDWKVFQDFQTNPKNSHCYLPYPSEHPLLWLIHSPIDRWPCHCTHDTELHGFPSCTRGCSHSATGGWAMEQISRFFATQNPRCESELAMAFSISSNDLQDWTWSIKPGDECFFSSPVFSHNFSRSGRLWDFM